MQYILGLDGGGTKTDCAIFTTDGQLVAFRQFGGTNHENFTNGLDELAPILTGIIRTVLSDAGLKPADILSAVFGMAGVDVSSQKRAIESIIASSGLTHFEVFNDSFLGIKASIPSGIGCCLVNGTGNTICGIDKNGKFLQIAGTGLMFGEEGGGDRIASRVIRICYDELFRCGEKSTITPEILKLFEVNDPYSLVDAVYDKYHTQIITSREILNVLFTCANEGDPAARDLWKSIGVEFAKSLAGCISHLDFDSHVDIALVGSVTQKATSPLMLEALEKTLPALTHKTHRFLPAVVSPVSGAVLWAMERFTRTAVPAHIRERVISELIRIPS